MSDKQQSNEVVCPIITQRKDIKVIIEGYSDHSLGGTLGHQNKPVQELVENVDITECIEDGCLRLKKLIIIIKNQFNFPFESTSFVTLDKEVYFYLGEVDIFLNCGIDPITEDIKIRPENFENSDVLTVKGKDLGISMVHRLMSFENNVGNNQDKERSEMDEGPEKSKCRRTKERRIGHIIDKVIEWRKYYSGTVNGNNQQVIKFSLEDAAKQVKISKKSLDDYLFQVRFGHRYGFNFNEHYNDKVGVLRDFVRQRKRNDKTDNKGRKNQHKAMERGEDF